MYKQKISTDPIFGCYRYAVFTTKFKILYVAQRIMFESRNPRCQEYIGSVYRYLPSHVKNGIVILLCIFEIIIVAIKNALQSSLHI